MGEDKQKDEARQVRIEQFPLKRKWDFRTGSPHRVFRAAQDVVEDLGYSIQPIEPLKLEESPISDTATFKANVNGEKQIRQPYKWAQGVMGIVSILAAIVLFANAVGRAAGGNDIVMIIGMIAIGIGLTILGIALIATASEVRKQVIVVGIEGEAYKAAATVVEGAQAMDVVADVRVTVAASIGTFAGGAKIKEKLKDADMKILETDFVELQKRIEAVLPSFM